MRPASDSSLLTVRDLAHTLQIRPSTLYAWAAQGKIPCLKIHGILRFRAEDITRWLDTFRIQGASDSTVGVPGKSATPIDALIARARQAVYSTRRGETNLTPSPTGKENADGTR